MKKQEKQTYILTVYNTMTGLYEDVEVSEEVYCEYRRGLWRINKNEDKHRAGEIPFSALLGGDGGEYENFHEFIDRENDPETILLERQKRQKAFEGLSTLSAVMRERFILHFQNGMTTAEIAEMQGVSEYSVKESLKQARKKLKKYLRTDPSFFDFRSYTGERRDNPLTRRRSCMAAGRSLTTE